MAEQRKQGLDTLALHAGQVPDPTTLARAVPIYQTTSYVFRDSDHAANLFALREFGNIYTRLMNPTTDVLEKRLAALHGGTGCVATASGQAAIFYTVAAITSAGQNIVTGANLYGGTVTLFNVTLKRFGIEVRFVDSSDPKNFEKAINKKTRLLFCETIGNPVLDVADIQAKTDALMQASHKLAEAVYQQAQQEHAQGGGQSESGGQPQDENVEEGDYEVIDEDEQK